MKETAVAQFRVVTGNQTKTAGTSINTSVTKEYILFSSSLQIRSYHGIMIDSKERNSTRYFSGCTSKALLSTKRNKQ